jgi:hypothetical protein
MAYGVDAYGRPLSDDPNAAAPRQQQPKPVGNPSALDDPSNPPPFLPPPQRNDNTAPQQQGQQPATPQQQQQPSAQQFISQYQQSHAANQGIGGLADALAQNGYSNATRYMYGNTPSNNELSLDGQKFKVMSGENGSNPAWFAAGTDDGGGAMSAPQGAWQQYTAGQLPNQKLGEAGGYAYNKTAMPSYQAGQLSTQGLPAYMAAQMAQYQQPGQAQGLNDSMSGLMAQLMANPNSMSDQGVAQLKEQQKEQALSMQQQLQAQGGQQAASLGTYGSGQQLANDQRFREGTMNSVLSGNRAIDLQKMMQDRTDQLGVLNAGQGLTNSLTNQAQGNYGATLQGQGAQANQNLQQQQSQAAQVQFDLQRQMNQEGLNQSQAGSQQNATNYGFQVQQADAASQAQQQQYALQQALAQQGLYQQSAQINNQTVAGQLAQQLAYAQLGQNDNQFQQNYGLRLNGL